MMTLNFVMVARTLDFVWMFNRGTDKLTGSLPKETLCEKCPYWDFFWSVFFHIQTLFTQYLYVCSPNAENMNQKNFEHGHFSRSESHSKSSNTVKL